MNKRLIIGLTGHGSSGKWTVGNLLRCKLNFKHSRFDDPVRAMVCQLHGINPWILHSVRHHPQAWLNECSLGYIMDEVAQLLRAMTGPDVLEERMRRTLTNSLDNPYGRTVISDVKTIPQAQIVKDHGGLILRLRRSADDLGRDFKTSDYAPLPECMIDATIMNTGKSLFPLKRQIIRAVKEIL